LETLGGFRTAILAFVVDGIDRETSVEVFCSYSHRDEDLRKEFEAHVALMRRKGLIRIWHDRQILAGDDWAGEIDSHLDSADLITLFVSSDFLNSDYCYEKEMTRALERNLKEKTLVVPIIVRACDWQEAPFSNLQAVPTNAKAVTSWTNRDEAWTDVAAHLKLCVAELLTRLTNRLQRLKEIEASGEDTLAFIFPTDDPVEIKERVERGREWQRNQRAERSNVLKQAQEKIKGIRDEVEQGATPERLANYEKWEQYIQALR
jgi:TIR domain